MKDLVERNGKRRKGVNRVVVDLVVGNPVEGNVKRSEVSQQQRRAVAAVVECDEERTERDELA